MVQPKVTISTGDITDFQYDCYGARLAVSDSTGHIHIFLKKDSAFVLEKVFQATDSYILSIAWGKECNILAIGTFKNRLIVFAERSKGVWEEVAWYDKHEGPVNKVVCGPIGDKIIASSSDGCFSFMEVVKNKWQMGKVKAHTGSVNCLAIKPTPLASPTSISQVLVTAGKDSTIKFWSPNKSTDTIMGGLFEQEGELCGDYHMILQIKVGPVRRLIWRNQFALSFVSELIYALETGQVINLKVDLNSKKHKQIGILTSQHICSNISQSLTGDVIIVSMETGEKWTCQQKDGKWISNNL